MSTMGACVNGSLAQRVVKSLLPRRSEVVHPFIRAHRGTSCAGAREDSREEQRPLMHGSRKRPHRYARLLLPLDDLAEPTLRRRQARPLSHPPTTVSFERAPVCSRSRRATSQRAYARGDAQGPRLPLFFRRATAWVHIRNAAVRGSEDRQICHAACTKYACTCGCALRITRPRRCLSPELCSCGTSPR